MTEDLELTTPLDRASLVLVDTSTVLQEVEEQINHAIETKDIDFAMQYCRHQMDKMRLSGISLAKALWLIEKNWNIFRLGDDFIPTTQDYLGIHPHTIERYVKVWEMVALHVPKEFQDQIIQKPIGSLIPAANAVAQGYEIDKDEWEKIIHAPDKNTVAMIVRDEIKEATPRKNALGLRMDNNGSLWVYAGNTVSFFGSLEIKDENDYVQKAIERVIANAGIMRG